MSTDIIATNVQADNGYGQNGYDGASSDLPGKHTTSGFLPQAKVPTDNWQTRSVPTQGIPVNRGAHGRAANAAERVPSKVSYR